MHEAILKKTLLTLLLGTLAIACAEPLPTENGRLVRTVILSRHGVRSPTQSDQVLKTWSDKSWPVWPVAPGELTERGKSLIKAQWKAMREQFVSQGLLPENSCPGAGLKLIADTKQRTLETSYAIGEGLAPACTAPETDTGYRKLFQPDFNTLSESEKTIVINGIAKRLDRLNETNGLNEKLERLQKMSGCCTQDAQHVPLDAVKTHIAFNQKSGNFSVTGKWTIASTLTEILVLEYGQWPRSHSKWPYANEATIRDLMPIHNQTFDAIHRTPVLAKKGGSALLKAIVRMLFSDRSPKLTILVGHDTNIAHIGSLLSLDWSIPNQGDNPIMPGSFMSFTLVERQNARQEVLVHFHSPSLAFLHATPARMEKPITVEVSQPVFTREELEKVLEDLSCN